MLTERMGWTIFIYKNSTNEIMLCFSFLFDFTSSSVSMSFGILKNLFPRKNQPQISEISTPISVKKDLHVTYDPVTKTFHGLPPEWEEQVKSLFTYVLFFALQSIDITYNQFYDI